MIFVFFSVFFRCRFSSALRKAKKSSNMSQQDTESENFGPGSDDPLAPGERQREGYKIFALHKELGFSDLPSVIGQDVSDSEFETNLARRWHTCGGRRIETPRGGPPPAIHLWRICDRDLGPTLRGHRRLSIKTGFLWHGKFSASSQQVLGIHGQQHRKS